MSAHYGAPGFRRPQVATPAYSAEAQGSSIPARSAHQPVVKRKAMLVAAATLCAPALAVAALGAIGATTSGNQAGMGSLPGTDGLRGSTTAAPTPTPSPANADERDGTEKGSGKSLADTHHARHHPATQAPAHRPSHPPTPPPSTHIGRTPPHTEPTLPGAYDPTQPGSPTTGSGSDGTLGSGSGAGTGTGSGSGTGTGTGSGSGSGTGTGTGSGSGTGTSGPSDEYDAYSGGG
jgi:hypothetical protein